MKIYLVRHGETDWNKTRRVQGSADIPLNAYGVYLAEETAKGLKDIHFDVAFTSPLIRARKTAEVILAGRNIEILDEPAIQEMNFGHYEGMCVSGEQKAAESEIFNRFFVDTDHYVPGRGGESVEELLERTGTFLKQLFHDPKRQKQTILLSTHGAAMTALLNNMKGNMEIRTFWKEGVPPNCAVTIVEVQNGVPRMIDENHVYYKEAIRSWNVGE